MSSLAISTIDYKRGNKALVKKGYFVYTIYQYKDFSNLLPDECKTIYLNGRADQIWAPTAVSGGTFTAMTHGVRRADQNYTFRPSHRTTAADRAYLPENAPTDAIQITAAGANQGIRITAPFNLSKSFKLCIVVSGTTASVAGKIKIQSTPGTNESVCSFTTSATVGQATRHVFDFQTNGSTGVTWTGTPVFSTVTNIEITLDAAGTIGLYGIFFTANDFQVPGQILTSRFNCIDEYGREEGYEDAKQMCANSIVGSVGTGRAPTINVTSTTTNQYIEAISKGFVPTVMIEQRLTKLQGTYTVPSTGPFTVTLPSLPNVDHIMLQNAGMVNITTTGVANDNFALYNPTTGVLTFPASLAGYSSTSTTKNMEIWVWETVSITGYVVAGNDASYSGYLQLLEDGGNSKELTISEKALIKPAETELGDATNNRTYNFDLMAIEESEVYYKSGLI
jgi:hypothetical protein